LTGEIKNKTEKTKKTVIIVIIVAKHTFDTLFI